MPRHRYMVVPSLPRPPRRLHVSLSLSLPNVQGPRNGRVFSPFLSLSLSAISPPTPSPRARASLADFHRLRASEMGRRRGAPSRRYLVAELRPPATAAASMAARRRLRPAASLSPRISPAAAAAAADMLQLYLPSPLHRRRPASSPPRPPLHLPPPAHPFLPAPSLLPLPLRFG